MKLEIHGKNLDVTDALKKHIEKACLKLKKMRFLSNEDVVHVEIKYYKDKSSKAVFTYKAKRIGKIFVATGEAIDLYVAINNARDKIFSQLKKVKDAMS